MSLEPIPLRMDAVQGGTPRAPVPFSLFDGDGFRTLLARLGLGNQRPFAVLRRCLVSVLVTWVPVALLAGRQGMCGLEVSPINFCADFAAYAQFLLALPLFFVAEAIIDQSTREAAQQFVGCGVVRPGDATTLDQVHATLERWRKSKRADLLCILIAYMLSFAILVPEFTANAYATWHMQDNRQFPYLTAAGIWEFLIALPLLNYIWLRFVWKIFLWCYYLYCIAHLDLELHPTHPDLTGGIGFVSETQGRFALFILAYGISNVAATVGYEIAILNYDFATLPVWGPLVGFAIGAPLLFTLPLFMFTKQLFRAKKRALAIYRERLTEQSRRVESRWTATDTSQTAAVGDPAEEMRAMAELATLGSMFTRIEQMRVVPFDLRSFAQLIGSTVGALAVVLPLLDVKGELAGIFEVIAKVLGKLSGGG